LGKADYQLDGYEIFWYSNDHAPAHFNVQKKGHWGIKVYFELSNQYKLSYVISWQNKSIGPTSKELKLLREYVQAHKAHLQHEWEVKVCKQS